MFRAKHPHRAPQAPSRARWSIASGRPSLTACLLALLAAWASMAAPCSAAERRIALVIGNSAYTSGALPNPANDAKLIAGALSDLGFEVIARRNADQVTMKRAIQEFGERLERAGPDAVGLFYYAGHGVQLNGRNYLIPTTAEIQREADVEIEAVSADWVIEQMRYARNRLNIMVLDACRNNPFTRSMRGVDHGLASMDAPAGILIAYSTAPGEVAQDGAGNDSPYTQALTQAMRTLHEPVEQVFKHVRVNVMSATSGKQVPWESSSLTGDFYFSPPKSEPASRLASAAPSSPAVPPAAVAANPTASGAPDAGRGTASSEHGASSSSSGGWFSGWFGSKPAAASTGTSTAAAAPGSSGRPAAPGSAPAPTHLASLAATLPSGVAYIPGERAVPLMGLLGIEATGIDFGHTYPFGRVRDLIEHSARRVTLGSTPEQIRTALALCRQYQSDCKPRIYDDERLRTVKLEPFELDSTAVSVREFRQFVEATHYVTEAERQGFAYALGPEGHLVQVEGGSWRNAVKRHAVEEAAPVVGVSYQDALAFCRYKGSRLPSEDEWEYVARGPRRTVFPWGDDAAPVVGRALSVVPRVDDGPNEGIAGRYRGLAGSVWQWVDTSYQGHKVLKGGSWLESNPANKRSAVRLYMHANTADEDSGFRCARATQAWPDADYWLAQLR